MMHLPDICPGMMTAAGISPRPPEKCIPHGRGMAVFLREAEEITLQRHEAWKDGRQEPQAAWHRCAAPWGDIAPCLPVGIGGWDELYSDSCIVTSATRVCFRSPMLQCGAEGTQTSADTQTREPVITSSKYKVPVGEITHMAQTRVMVPRRPVLMKQGGSQHKRCICEAVHRCFKSVWTPL